MKVCNLLSAEHYGILSGHYMQFIMNGTHLVENWTSRRDEKGAKDIPITVCDKDLQRGRIEQENRNRTVTREKHAGPATYRNYQRLSHTSGFVRYAAFRKRQIDPLQ